MERRKAAECTVVLPVHNEEKLLPISLSSVYSLKPGEVIVLLDRCTDGSEEICRSYRSRYPETETRLIKADEAIGKGWKSRHAALRRYMYHLCTYDKIVNTSADIFLDARIAVYLTDLTDGVGLIKFGFMDYPHNAQSLLKRTISALPIPSSFLKGYAGLYALSKNAWMNSESESVAKTVEAEDALLIMSISEKYRTLYRDTLSLHLRPAESRERNFWRGTEYYGTVHATLFRAFLHSVVMLRPDLLRGYLYARRIHSHPSTRRSQN